MTRTIWKKIALALVVLLAAYLLFLGSPLNFSKNTIVDIPKGVSIADAARILVNDKIIFSPTIFKVILKLSKHNVIAGKYLFDSRENIFEVSKRISNGDFGFKIVKVTFPEGVTIAEEANICASILPLCKSSEFEALAKGKEGYIFPDTYLISESADAKDVIRIMNANFADKIAAFKIYIDNFGHSLNDVIIMASIVEREGKTLDDRRMISGILWKRLRLGMPLQADATSDYTYKKNIIGVATDVLPVDSPFDTYKNRGLPPSPICNPGIESIEATVEPISSPYLYYLSDKNGVFHYAENFNQHLINKKRYLRQ